MPFFFVTLFTYALTLFVSATLLFLVQPMIGKMILPYLGGTPAVWNTCMVFFQAALLAGYSYAHGTIAWLGVRKQSVLHIVLIFLPLFVLPIGIVPDLIPQGGANPVLGVLLLLLVSVGLPFTVISTTAPLLQKWFANTGHPMADDPYFLYGSSNLGSMLGLLSYPFLVEPSLRVRYVEGGLQLLNLHGDWLSQAGLWAIGYAVLVVLILGCAVLLWVAPTSAQAYKQTQADRIHDGNRLPTVLPAEGSLQDMVTGWQRLRWIALAFVPSSMMLGATTYITTDIAAIPLLWVLPLTLYLLSFIIVFSKMPRVVHDIAVLLMPLAMLALVALMIEAWNPKAQELKILVHLAALFLVAMVCHGELALSRPSTRHLTEFYLLMSVGGVLGGLFNALIAPVIFNSLLEYPLVMVFACLLLPQTAGASKTPWSYALDVLLPIALCVLAVALISQFFVIRFDFSQLEDYVAWKTSWVTSALNRIQKGLTPSDLEEALQRLMDNYLKFVVLGVICYLFVDRPVRFSLGIAAILLASGLADVVREDVLLRHRSFFGALKVERISTKLGDIHKLLHGTTLHGEQHFFWTRQRKASFCLPLGSTNPYELAVACAYGAEEWIEPKREALTYYHRTGPIGQVFQAFRSAGVKPNLAFIGLGTGTLASYGAADQRVTFFEIDQAVRDIAENKAYRAALAKVNEAIERGEDEEAISAMRAKAEKLNYFTYVSDALERGVNLQFVMGDARLQMEKLVLKDDEKYGLIVVDAFTSDAIPVHLLNREAIKIYLAKLAPGGVLAFHISNRYLDLEHPLANLEKDLDLVGILQSDESENWPGKSASSWVLLMPRIPEKDPVSGMFPWQRDDEESWDRYFGQETRDDLDPVEVARFYLEQDGFYDTVVRKYFGILTDDTRHFPGTDENHNLRGARGRWRPLWWDRKEEVGVWTDDYCNLFSIFRFNILGSK